MFQVDSTIRSAADRQTVIRLNHIANLLTRYEKSLHFHGYCLKGKTISKVEKPKTTSKVNTKRSQSKPKG